MSGLSRRGFLGLGTMGLALSGLSRVPAAAALPAAFRPRQAGQKKLLIVFLRGGNDATNSVIPVGDPEYYSSSVRPTLAIPTSSVLDTGSSYAAFHPSLAKLKEVHDLGQVASIQRVGYPNSSLSHFAGQRYVETAVPGDNTFDEGWVTRWAAATPLSGLGAVSVSPQLQRMFKGSPALPHIPDVSAFTLGGDAAASKLLGRDSSSGNRSGLRAIWELAGQGDTRDLVNDAGAVAADVIEELDALPANDAPADYYPTDSATLAAEGLPQDSWATTHFANLRDAVYLLKYSSTTVCGVDMLNWDHHSAQGATVGQHADHLAVVAHGIRSARLDTLDTIWNDLVVVVLSEFGRTSNENGAKGTDHGRGGLMWVAGGGVQGGIYNCDSATWPANQTLFSADGKFVQHLTDYRTVLAEVFERQLGASPSDLAAMFPGWAGFSGPEYDYVNFLA